MTRNGNTVNQIKEVVHLVIIATDQIIYKILAFLLFREVFQVYRDLELFHLHSGCGKRAKSMINKKKKKQNLKSNFSHHSMRESDYSFILAINHPIPVVVCRFSMIDFLLVDGE